MKFYHYVHCPFCQRVRLALGFKGLEYEDIVLSYADKATPESLIGAKMLPIIDFGEGTIMGESLDLIVELDKKFSDRIRLFPEDVEVDLAWASSVIFSMPRYFDLLLPQMLEAYKDSAEFDAAGAEYFQSSKETKRGTTFEQLRTEAVEIYTENVLPKLKEIEKKLDDGFIYEVFSAADCVLAADLSALRIIPGIELPAGIVSYLEAVEEVCEVDLLKN